MSDFSGPGHRTFLSLDWEVVWSRLRRKSYNDPYGVQIVKYATIVASGLFLLLSSALGQDAGKKGGDPTDGMEILRKADAAVKKIKLVQYKATARGLGADEGRSPTTEGTAALSGWENRGPAKYRYEVKVKQPASDEVAEYTAGCDGDITYLIDPAKKIAYADIDPAVLGSSARMVRAISVGKLVDPDGFADELKAEKIELAGSTKIDDVECFELHITYDGRGGEGTFAIAKTDFLPRRIVRYFQRPDGEKRGREVVLSEVKINPNIDKDPFTLTVPEGFTKTDDFAP